jgi:hypothetical protein
LQAAYAVRTYALALRLGVASVDIMFIVDSDGFNGGFFPRGNAPWRPSAHAVQTMIRLMPNPRLVETLSDGDDGCFAYVFDANGVSGRRVIMAWVSTGARTVTIPCMGAARLTDMLGAQSTIERRESGVRLHAGPYPVYVEDLSTVSAQPGAGKAE